MNQNRFKSRHVSQANLRRDMAGTIGWLFTVSSVKQFRLKHTGKCTEQFTGSTVKTYRSESRIANANTKGTCSALVDLAAPTHSVTDYRRYNANDVRNSTVTVLFISNSQPASRVMVMDQVRQIRWQRGCSGLTILFLFFILWSVCPTSSA